MYIYSRWNVDWWPDDRCAGSMPETMFKINYSAPYAWHETATSSHIVKYWYRITCPSIWKHNVYIHVHLQSMKRRGTFDWMQCQDGVVSAVLSIGHTYGMLFCLLTTHTNYRWLCACTVCKWVTIHGETPRDLSWLGTGHKNNILTMDDSCSFRLTNTRKVRS